MNRLYCSPFAGGVQAFVAVFAAQVDDLVLSCSSSDFVEFQIDWDLDWKESARVHSYFYSNCQQLSKGSRAVCILSLSADLVHKIEKYSRVAGRARLPSLGTSARSLVIDLM